MFYIDISLFLHNTDAKMCLLDQESNNAEVGFSKYLKIWHNWPGRELEVMNNNWLFSVEDYYTESISLENIQDNENAVVHLGQYSVMLLDQVQGSGHGPPKW